MTVKWREITLDLLADLFVASDLDTQDAIEQAVLSINATLATDPMTQGESRATDNRRSWNVDPVTVLFEIFPADDLVVAQHFAMRRK